MACTGWRRSREVSIRSKNKPYNDLFLNLLVICSLFFPPATARVWGMRAASQACKKSRRQFWVQYSCRIGCIGPVLRVTKSGSSKVAREKKRQRKKDVGLKTFLNLKAILSLMLEACCCNMSKHCTCQINVWSNHYNSNYSHFIFTVYQNRHWLSYKLKSKASSIQSWLAVGQRSQKTMKGSIIIYFNSFSRCRSLISCDSFYIALTCSYHWLFP